MAHHQKHGAERDTPFSRALQNLPAAGSMPAVSEDDVSGEADEPPEKSLANARQNFSKSMLPYSLRRSESLLTQALHTDSESYADDDVQTINPLKQAASISSTCSTFSVRSIWDCASDDGQLSTGTRASTPNSPRTMAAYERHMGFAQLPKPLVRVSSHPVGPFKADMSPEKPQEGTVEATLGRKRCITFACSNKAPSAPVKEEPKPVVDKDQKRTDEPAKRPCTIKFACPFKATESSKPKSRFGRHLSPAPPVKKAPSPSSSSKRNHRDSDTTIRNCSPRPGADNTPTPSRLNKLKRNLSPIRGEKMKCHVFASSDDGGEDWLQESTVHRSRLTVDDTLSKENTIRRLGEEAEEEAALEEDDDDMEQALDDDDDDDDDEDDYVSDEGFHSDDEGGFAESDDDADDDSDYEWWTPRHSKVAASPFVPRPHFGARHRPKRSNSDSSMDSATDHFSPRLQPAPTSSPAGKMRRRSQALDIKPDMSDLPDSTDFVCGTLDEDRPLEEAYATNLKQRQAAKHKTVPQDIDPSFPTSDPEMGMDEEDDDEEENAVPTTVYESDHANVFGVNGPAALDEEFCRGRRSSTQLSTPLTSPRRPRSPAVQTVGKCIAPPRSPAPPRIVMHASPTKITTPTVHRAKSPHPSLRSSPDQAADAVQTLTLKHHPFLTARHHKVTHTASLPRSPAPINRKMLDSATVTGESTPNFGCSDVEDDDDDDALGIYDRKAIDIKQGLEHKRLRRRQKLYSLYAQKAEKKKSKRPTPGRGADRMRQVGIECSKYRGKKMISM